FTASALTLRADNISGSYTNDCTALVKLWDLSGSYTEDNGLETESFNLDMDANGIITGTGHFNLTDDQDGVYLDGDANVSGKVTSAGSVTRVTLSLVTTGGTGTVTGIPINFVATLKESFEVDDAERTLVGKGSGNLKITLPSTGKSRTIKVPPGATTV